MKATEAIVMLCHIIKAHGDLDVVMVTGVDENFMIEEGREIEVVGLPNDDGTDRLVAAFVEPQELDGDDEPQRPNLTRVK